MKKVLLILCVMLTSVNALSIPYNEPDEVRRHDMGYVIYSSVICKKNYALAVVVTGDGVTMVQLMAPGEYADSPLKPVRCK